VSTTPRAPRVQAQAEAVLRRADFAGNPYLRALADGSMPAEVFRRTQEQFYFAVAYFPRPMAALLSRMPDPADRLDVLHNLVEEHGGFRPEEFHPATFRRFLRSVGAADDPAALTPGPAVHAFNALLHGTCLADLVETGLCCLGVIELAFAGVSAAVGRAVVDRGWVRADGLVHYRLHAEIDGRHAEEFFAVAEPGWDDPGRRAAAGRGLELGAYAFDRLYRDLLAAGR
jgi:pyrroloquinoline-quinone synthase